MQDHPFTVIYNLRLIVLLRNMFTQIRSSLCCLIHVNLFILKSIGTKKMGAKANALKFVTLLVVVILTQNFDIEEIENVKSDCTTDCCRTLPDRQPMTYVYYQKTGKFVGGAGDYKIDTLGYSGQGKGYLNPDEECTPSIGPLPASVYKLAYCKNKMHETTDRPCSFYLDPQRPEEVCGRGDFFIHGCQCCTSGDDAQPPTAGCSAGCVIISYANRRKLRLGDTLIVRHYQESEE